MMTLQWPYKYKNYTLLYIVQYEIDGPMNCTSDMEINPLKIKVSRTLLLGERSELCVFWKHTQHTQTLENIYAEVRFPQRNRAARFDCQWI